jgi:hypothetical protein
LLTEINDMFLLLPLLLLYHCQIEYKGKANLYGLFFSAALFSFAVKYIFLLSRKDIDELLFENFIITTACQTIS